MTSGWRAMVSGGIGVVAALVSIRFVPWQAVPLIGWGTAATAWVAWIWLTIGRFGPEDTAVHATGEDPSRAAADLGLVIAAVASLVGVAFGIIKAADVHGGQQAILIAAAATSIVAGWFVVHTVYALRYAGLYYQGPDGGVDFNEDSKPCYTDFAYLSFTIGMTFQVSDTNLTAREVRRTALHHALLSYLFGTVIVATTINLVAGLVR